MKVGSLAVCALAGHCFLCSSMANAAIVVDQFFDPQSLNSADIPDGNTFISADAGREGQSFTVGLDGTLERIDLNIRANNLYDIDGIEIRLQSLAGFFGTVLATEVYTSSDLPDTFDTFFTAFDNLGLAVSAGEAYSVLITATDTTGGFVNRFAVEWSSAFSNTADLYDGGYTFDSANGGFNPNSFIDSGFRTYVDTATTVPVPAAAWLFGSALLGLAGIKRKGVFA